MLSVSGWLQETDQKANGVNSWNRLKLPSSADFDRFSWFGLIPWQEKCKSPSADLPPEWVSKQVRWGWWAQRASHIPICVGCLSIEPLGPSCLDVGSQLAPVDGIPAPGNCRISLFGLPECNRSGGGIRERCLPWRLTYLTWELTRMDVEDNVPVGFCVFGVPVLRCLIWIFSAGTMHDACCGGRWSDWPHLNSIDLRRSSLGAFCFKLSRSPRLVSIYILLFGTVWLWTEWPGRILPDGERLRSLKVAPGSPHWESNWRRHGVKTGYHLMQMPGEDCYISSSWQLFLFLSWSPVPTEMWELRYIQKDSSNVL